MESLISASSFITDVDDSTEPERMDLLNVQNIILQNERLQEMNTQLNSSLESVKMQLKQALEASSTVSNMSEQIKLLKTQLLEANKKYEKAVKELQLWKEKKTPNIESNHPENPEQPDLKAKLRKLKKENKELRAQIEEKTITIEELKASESKLNKKKAKSAKRLQACLTKLDELEKSNSATSAMNDSLQTENESLRHDIDDMKLQIQAIQSQNREAGIAFTNANEELEKSNSAFASLAQHLDSQAQEIADLNAEKGAMIELIKKLHNAMCTVESVSEDLKERNDVLEKNAKTRKIIPPGERINLKELEFPFDGEIKDKCREICAYDHYQPIQRLQMVLNELSKYGAESAREIERLNAELDKANHVIEEERAAADSTKQILNALMRELQEVAKLEEEVSQRPFCESDQEFVEMMMRESLVMERLGANEVKEAPIPVDFFGTDVVKKKQVILKEIKPNDDAFAIFSAQFSIDLMLKKIVNRLMESVLRKDDINELFEVLPHGDGDDFAESLQKFKDELQRSSEEVSKSKRLVRKLQHNLLSKNRSESEQKARVDHLKLQNDTLRNECELLRVKCQVAENEVTVIRAEMYNDSQDHSHSSVDFAFMENELKEKDEEIQRLNSALQIARNSCESEFAQHKKLLKKKEHEFQTQLAKTENLLKEANNKNAELIKKLKKAKKTCVEKLTESERDHEKQIGSMKGSYEEITQAMKHESEQSREMSERLMQSLSEAEQHNQQIQAENVQLQMENKSLEVKISSMKEQMKKDKQTVDSKVVAQQLAHDSKLQEMMRSQRQSIEDAKKRIFSIVMHNLASVYPMNPAEFDEHSLSLLCEQIRSDIGRLRVFQSNVNVM